MLQMFRIEKHNAYLCGKQLVMAQMNLTSLDDVLDKHFGKVGTSKRDAFESDVDQALHAYRVGEAPLPSKLKRAVFDVENGSKTKCIKGVF